MCLRVVGEVAQSAGEEESNSEDPELGQEALGLL